MAGNQNPIYCAVPNNGVQNVILTTGAADFLGTNAAAALLFTAGANGSYLAFITCKPVGNTAATVLRVFINNGSTVGTAANNTLFREFSIAAQTVSGTAQTPALEFPMNVALQGGYKIYVELGTTVANGIAVSAFGGDF